MEKKKPHDLYLNRDRASESMLDQNGRDLAAIQSRAFILGIQESIKALENYRDELEAQASELDSYGR